HQGAEIIMPDNGIVERLHRTLLDEHFRVECRRACRKTSLRNFGGNAFGLSTDTGTPSSFSASILKAASVNRLVDRAGSTSKSRSLCSVSVPLTTDPKTRGRDRPWRLTSCRNSPLCTARASDGFMVVLQDAWRQRQLYRLPVMPRCGRVNRQAYHVWGMDDAGIFFFAANRGRPSCGAWDDARAVASASGF